MRPGRALALFLVPLIALTPVSARADSSGVPVTVTITGRFVDPQANPIPDIDVDDETNGGSAVSGADGTFTLTEQAVPDSTLTLSWFDLAGTWWPDDEQVTLAGTSADVGDLTVYPQTSSVTVTGRFLDRRGTPVARIGVQVLGVSTTSRADGTFRLVVSGSVTEPGGASQPLDLYWDDWSIGEYEPGHRTVEVTSTTVEAGDITLTRSVPFPRPSKKAVTRSSKSAVRAWYAKLRRLLAISDRGSRVHGCSVAAQPSKSLQRHTLDAINLVRELVAEKPVTLKSGYTKKAQQAALITYWNGLDHTPPKSAKCWSKAGYEGASHSNLNSGDAGAGTVMDYMTDTRNVTGPNAGHRSWLIDPNTRYMGVGQTSGPGAIYVVDSHATAKNPTPQWISWPTAGYFPRQIEPGGLWSFMTNQPGYDLSHASVKVTFAGKKLKVKKYYVSEYGEQAGLVWQLTMPTKHYVTRSGKYTVTISGIRYRHAKQPAHRYRVQLFNA